VLCRDDLPPHKDGTLLSHGHMHMLAVGTEDGMIYINPGSAARPKEGKPNSSLIYEDGGFVIKTLNGEAIRTHRI